MRLYPNNNDKEVNPNYTPPATTKKRDLIDRGQIQYTWWELPGGKFTDGVTLQSLIHSMPTVDAVEVVHGRWIVNVEYNNGENVIATCSACQVRGQVRTDRNEWGIWHINSPYCPNCGAKMDLRSE